MTKFPFSVSLVIPLYNNEETMKEQLRSCLNILNKTCGKFEILITEDKGIDGSKRILEKSFSKSPFKIIYHKINLGIAKTIKELYEKAKMDYVVLFSVDGDWNPQDIEKLLSEIYLTKSDIVIGKRNPQNYTFYRRVISFFYNLLPLVLFQVKTVDAGSIKVIKSNVLRNIPIKSKGVFFEAEIIIKAKKRGYKVNSIPVFFKKRRKGSGAGGDFKLVFQSIIDLLRLRFNF